MRHQQRHQRHQPLQRITRRHLIVFAASTLLCASAAAMDIEATSRALTRANNAVLGLHTHALADARSSALLGDERAGSGVLIGSDGLVLTLGDLVLEADEVELSTDDGRRWPARVLAYDAATGLGLVQALVPLRRAPAPMGNAARLDLNEPLVLISGGLDADVSTVRLLSRRDYAGGWEYQIDAALFTSPPRSDAAGAGLFNLQGELVGIGSRVVNNALGVEAGYVPGNLFVSIELLKPILQELRDSGSTRASQRAWLGLNCSDSDGELRVVHVAHDSPADVAGVQPGDHILRIDGAEVAQLGALWKRLWYGGGAERAVRLDIERDGARLALTLQSVDRAKTLRRARGI